MLLSFEADRTVKPNGGSTIEEITPQIKEIAE